MNQAQVIYRNAPAPKPGQDRVYHTLKHVVENAVDQNITQRKDDFFLGQGVLAQGLEEKIVAMMATGKTQDEAVLAYIKGEIGDPVSDAEHMMHRLDFGIQILNFRYIKNHYKEMKTGEVFGKFVLVRHGEKEKDGNLTENGIEEAKNAGKSIKEQHADMMPTAIFACQQTTVQSIMLSLLMGKHYIQGGNGKNASYHVREKVMPEARKTPYKTAEVTTFELVLGDNFSQQQFAKLHDNKGQEHDYLKEHVVLMVERNGHKEQFLLQDIDKYFSNLHEICI